MTMAAFGRGEYDSLQYHLYCEGSLVVLRVMRTASLAHVSVWIHADGALETLVMRNDAEIVSAGEVLRVESEGLVIEEERLAFAAGGRSFTADLNILTEAGGPDPFGQTLYQPDLEVELELDGRSLRGLGFARRVSWERTPRHSGYRLIQGFAADGVIKLWTLEATFGHRKIDGFELLLPGGRIVRAADAEFCHRQNAAHALLDGERFEVRMREQQVFEAQLVSPAMDSLLRQRVCTLEVDGPMGTVTGEGIAETCFGTLG